jgi:predicted Holliday junction resolvase-like endonuclease
MDYSVLIIGALILIFCIACLALGLRLGITQGRRLEAADWEAHRLEAIVSARLKQSRAVLGGLVSEQIAPLLPGFPYDPGDCRFVGKPVDFIVFKGMNEKNIDEVIFLEIKTGSRPGLNEQEKRLKETIKARRVKWQEIRLKTGLT